MVGLTTVVAPPLSCTQRSLTEPLMTSCIVVWRNLSAEAVIRRDHGKLPGGDATGTFEKTP